MMQHFRSCMDEYNFFIVMSQMKTFNEALAFHLIRLGMQFDVCLQNDKEKLIKISVYLFL